MSDDSQRRFDFEPPPPLRTASFHLEPLGPHHNERDHEAWMSSIDHIRATPGFEEWAWPVPMTLEENLADMAMHAREFAEQTGYTYSILDRDEVIGCVYIYPATPGDSVDATVRSWVRASRAGLDGTVRAAIAAWLESDWPVESIQY